LESMTFRADQMPAVNTNQEAAVTI
ncbi:hypothetical protein, partial [Bacillus inaquosorum]